jgi:hypothetical protein
MFFQKVAPVKNLRSGFPQSACNPDMGTHTHRAMPGVKRPAHFAKNVREDNESVVDAKGGPKPPPRWNADTLAGASFPMKSKR